MLAPLLEKPQQLGGPPVIAGRHTSSAASDYR